MASSGTYAYAPDNADLITEAFERCLVDPATLGSRHFKSAMTSINLLFSYWATKGVLLFAVDEQTQTVTDGLASYTAASGTLQILHGVIRRSGVDTPVHNMTREQYHAIPDKTAEGLPTQVWLDRRTGTYYLHHVPENSTDVFRYYRLRRLQDAGAGQDTPDLPYRWFEAMVSGLAEFLSLKFAPARHDTLKGLAADRLNDALGSDYERGDTSFGVRV